MSVLGTDDWTMFGAAILAVTLTGLGAASCLYGLGYHIWDLRPEWEEPYYKVSSHKVSLSLKLDTALPVLTR